MFRFLLFKFLPRRILPLLLLYEAYKFVMRMRAPHPQTAAAAYDDRIIDGRATVVTAPEDRLR